MGRAVRVGFAGFSWPGLYGEPAELSLERAAAASMEVVQFREPTALSPSLDVHRLTEIRTSAESFGLSVEMGVTYFELVGDRAADTVAAKFDACLAAGFREISTHTGLDRFDPAESMESQLDRLTRALEVAAPGFAEHGAHLNLETHEDLTSDEVVRVIDRLDPGIVGVTLDIANFAVNAEDPVQATRRVAQRVRQTHLEDFRLHLVPSGIRRVTCPPGHGAIDWTAIVGILAGLARPPTLCLELHRGQFDAAVFDETWIECHPDLRVSELAGQLAAAVAETERRGTDVVDRGPWPVPYGASPTHERVAAIDAGVSRLRAELERNPSPDIKT
jgi:sugar phosphate isomerase/epimerase